MFTRNIDTAMVRTRELTAVPTIRPTSTAAVRRAAAPAAQERLPFQIEADSRNAPASPADRATTADPARNGRPRNGTRRSHDDQQKVPSIIRGSIRDWRCAEAHTVCRATCAGILRVEPIA